MPDSLALQEFHSKKTSIGKSRRLFFCTSLFSNKCRPIVQSLAPYGELSPNDFFDLSFFLNFAFQKITFDSDLDPFVKRNISLDARLPCISKGLSSNRSLERATFLTIFPLLFLCRSRQMGLLCLNDIETKLFQYA